MIYVEVVAYAAVAVSTFTSLVGSAIVLEWVANQPWSKKYAISYGAGKERWEGGAGKAQKIRITGQGVEAGVTPAWLAALKTILIVVAGVVALIWVDLPMFRAEAILNPPTAPVAVCQLVATFYLADFLTWFIHWLFHYNDFLWEHVHRKHHLVLEPTGLSTFYAEIMDSLCNGAVPLVSAAVVLQPHVAVFCVVIVFTMVNFSVAHCGLKNMPGLELVTLDFLPFFEGARIHDWHHKFSKRSATNLGTFCSHWDKLFGTFTMTDDRRELSNTKTPRATHNQVYFVLS